MNKLVVTRNPTTQTAPGDELAFLASRRRWRVRRVCAKETGTSVSLHRGRCCVQFPAAFLRALHRMRLCRFYSEGSTQSWRNPWQSPTIGDVFLDGYYAYRVRYAIANYVEYSVIWIPDYDVSRMFHVCNKVSDRQRFLKLVSSWQHTRLGKSDERRSHR